MINKWNSFKEKAAMSVANLMPRALAYWAFIRVATFECTEHPGEQKCKTAADRWRDPARARRNFMGPAWTARIDELHKRRNSHRRDPVHQFDDFFYFWDETFTERIGPYSSIGRARLACLAYAKWLRDGGPDQPEHAPDVPQSDPRHPLNNAFLKSMDGNEWARAFIRIIRFNGTDLAVDEKFMSQWFSNAIMRGYDQGNPPTVVINALDAKGIAENGPAIAEALAKEIQKNSAQLSRFPEGD